MAEQKPSPCPASVSEPVPAANPINHLNWAELNAALLSCHRCELAQTRTQAVPGSGDAHAEWMFIGDAPGANEEIEGVPLVGDAGKLFDAMLFAIHLKRDKNVYLTNVVKSHPPANREPQPAEVAACLPYLERQVDLIKPKLIVALGRVAAQSLLATDLPMGKLRGQVHRFRGIPLVVTYHPIYLLRNPLDKAKVWDDLLLAVDTMQRQNAPAG
jgi:DNA polymerase